MIGSIWFWQQNGKLVKGVTKIDFFCILHCPTGVKCWSFFVCIIGQCSVTCGEGQQTREVICVGAGGEHLADHACRGMARPASVQACRRPACHTHITWHVTDYGLVGEMKQQQTTFISPLYPRCIYPLLPCLCSAPEAAAVVWGRGKWAALIQIWTPTQRPGVEQLADPSLWRHATRSPAPEHKVNHICAASTLSFFFFGLIVCACV